MACISLILAYSNSKHFVAARSLVKWRPNAEIAQLNNDLAAYSAPSPDIKVYATSGIGPRLSLRKYRYTLSPTLASQQFATSMVFVAQGQSFYPYGEYKDEILNSLLANPSLKLTAKTSELFVFTSIDLLGQETLQ